MKKLPEIKYLNNPKVKDIIEVLLALDPEMTVGFVENPADFVNELGYPNIPDMLTMEAYLVFDDVGYFDKKGEKKRGPLISFF